MEDKVFLVTIKEEFLVLAKSKNQAREILSQENALEHVFDLYSNARALPLNKRQLPMSWTGDEYIYNAKGSDITVAEAFDQVLGKEENNDSSIE